MKTLKNSNRLSQIDDFIEAVSTRLAKTNDEKEKETLRKKLSYLYGVAEVKKKERKEEGLKSTQEFF